MIFRNFSTFLRLIVLLALCWSTQVLAADKDLDKAIMRGDHKSAIKILSNQLSLAGLQPKDRAAMLGKRGIEHSFMGDFDLAMQDYDEAIKLQPNFALIYQMRGLTYEEMDQLPQAIQDFETVIRLSPDHIMGYVALAWIYAAGRDPEWLDGKKALHYAQQAAQIKKNPQVLNTLAVAQARNGQYKAAVAAQQSAIDMLKSARKAIAPEIIEENEERLALYQAGKPYTQPPLVLPRAVYKKRLRLDLLHPE